MREPALRVIALGRAHEVAATVLRAELQRSTGLPRPPLLEAVIRHAPRAQAIARLTAIVAQALQEAGPGRAAPDGAGSAATASRAHSQMQAALGLIYRGVNPTEAPAAVTALAGYAEALGGAAGAAIRAGVLLLSEGPAALGLVAARDPLLLRQATRAVCALGQPAPLCPALGPLCAAWVEALRSGQKALGTQALRGFLGDVCEALYRLAQRGGAAQETLLSAEDRSFLQDLATSELPGTADYLAARPMVWWLGVAAAGAPLDDAARAAIERARDRFRSEIFHDECALILSGAPWPPASPLP